MEVTTASHSGATTRGKCPEKITIDEGLPYKPMGANEISKISASPTPPPAGNDLPSYPSVPFLLHPHRPLLMWCSSSAVHAFDFMNHRWEAGGPQQLQMHLQHLHSLPIAAADCICTDCGSRSSALRDSSTLSKRHAHMRRSLSQTDTCPYLDNTVYASTGPSRVRLCDEEISAATQGNTHGPDEATCSEGAAGDPIKSSGATEVHNEQTTTASASLADSSAAGGFSGCVWVTAGEDKYLHFVDVRTYKLLRSRLQRKKLSAVIFLRPSHRARGGAAFVSGKGSLSQGIINKSGMPEYGACTNTYCPSKSLSQEQHKRPRLQLLIADKFGDIYLLQDCLGAPFEQSLAGDLLHERMRTVPSVAGVRVCAISGASALKAGCSGGPEASAATHCVSATIGDTTTNLRSVVNTPRAAEHPAGVVMHYVAGSGKAGGAHCVATHPADSSQQTLQNRVEAAWPIQSYRGAEPHWCGISGQVMSIKTSAAAVKGGVLAADNWAEANDSTVPRPNGLPPEKTEKAETLCTSTSADAKGGDTNNPLLIFSAEGQGAIAQKDSNPRSSSTGAPSPTSTIMNEALPFNRVVTCHPVAALPADTTFDAGGNVALAAVTASSKSCVRPGSTGWPLADMEDVEQPHASQRAVSRCPATRSKLSEQVGGPSVSKKSQESDGKPERREMRQLKPRQIQQLPLQAEQQDLSVDQQGEEARQQLLTREQRFRTNAWQRERSRVWRLQHLFQTTKREQKEQQGERDTSVNLDTATDRQTKTDAEEAFLANEFADIPLLSHLTTITVMKVFLGNCLPRLTCDNAACAAVCAMCKTRALAASQCGDSSEKLCVAGSGTECGAAALSSTTSVSSGTNAFCPSPCRDPHACLYSSHSEGGSLRSHLRSSEGCAIDLLLTADRDEKVRICALEKPWSIESFFLGHSEFVADCLLIADGCVCNGGCSSCMRKERLIQDEARCNCRTALDCHPTDTHSNVRVGPANYEFSRNSDQGGSVCLFESSMANQYYSNQDLLSGTVGISAGADGTLQLWRVSDGTQIDELSLIPDSLFSSEGSDLACVHSCCEVASVGPRPRRDSVPCTDEASRLAIDRESGDPWWRCTRRPNFTTVVSPSSSSSSRRLLPLSLLFDDDQHLLVVQCLKVRGLLLVPLEQRRASATPASHMQAHSVFLNRHPFFIPFPAVPAAVLLLYHSLEEMNKLRALLHAAQALQPVLASRMVPRKKGGLSPEHEPYRQGSSRSSESTSRYPRCLRVDGAHLTSNCNTGDGVSHFVPGAVPFVWWIDETGMLRPPVCISVSLLRAHSRELEELQRPSAGFSGTPWSAAPSTQILPYVEGCSRDVLGTDYGIGAAPANSVYFWKRTRSSTCPTQAERAARRLRHSRLRDQQQRPAGANIVQHSAL